MKTKTKMKKIIKTKMKLKRLKTKQEGWLPPTKRASAAKINQYYRL